MDDPRSLAHAVDAALAGAPGVDAGELRTRLTRARGALLELLKTQVSRRGGRCPNEQKKTGAGGRRQGLARCPFHPCSTVP